MSEPLERPATPIGGCGLCSGLMCGSQHAEHLGRLADVPELALVVERLGRAPQLQDDLERLARHVAVDARHAVDVEHRPVARQARGGDAEVEPPARDVVEHGDAVRELGRMVIGQQEAAGAEPDVLGLHQRLRDQQVGRGMRLPRRGVMLADPAFGEAQLVEPADHLQVPLVAVLERPLGRMRRHREISELHRFLLGRFWRKSTTIGGGAQGIEFAWQAMRAVSEPARLDGIRQQHPDAQAVKGQDDEQICLAEEIVRAHDRGRKHDAARSGFGQFPHRHAEIEMLVVAAGDDLRLVLPEQGEARDLLADARRRA